MLLHEGRSLTDVARSLEVSRSTLRAWQACGQPILRSCARCDDADLPAKEYAALLGYYLGDGCVSVAGPHVTFRVSCDVRFPNVVSDVVGLIRGVNPGRKVFEVPAPGVTVVHSNWKHWPCLFPQHGPGRKHERPIVLEDWQQEIVAEHPADLLRGLFHSDGSRVRNWATRVVGGQRRRYDYPRWQFTNNSRDIQLLCCAALDAAGIAWRQSNWKTISVSTRAAVATLDQLIGLKR